MINSRLPVWQIIAAMILMAAVALPTRSQTVIAGNLGTNNGFQSSTGTAWATGPGAPLCNGSPCDPANAVAFTIPSGGSPYLLNQFKVAINRSAGTNSVTVELHVAGPDSSINSATFLQSFTLMSPAATTGQPGQLVTQSVSPPILLLPGNTYFLEMIESNAVTDFGWQWNNIGKVGYFAAFLPSLDSTPSWFAPTCPDPGCATPAFEADGTLVSGPLAYVTNQNAGTVSVIDTSSGTVVATVPLLCGECTAAPAGLAVTPNGRFVYVTVPNKGNVQVIDTSQNKVTATVNLTCSSACSPQGIAITPDGNHAYVTDVANFAVDVIDTSTNMVSTLITSDVGNPNGPIAISADGAAAYYTFGLNSAGRIATSTNSHTTTITVGNNPLGVAVTPDFAHVYVTNKADNTVSVFATGLEPGTPSTIGVGSGPVSIAFTPDGTTAFVANQTDGSVSVISTSTNTVSTTVTGAGTTLNQIAITPDGRTAYVAAGGNNNAEAIYTATDAVAATIGVGAVPFGVAMGPAASCGDPTACESATLNGSAQTVTFAFDNNAHLISFSVPAGWCANPPCTVNTSYQVTTQAQWAAESANYPGTSIAPIPALGNNGAVYTVTCFDNLNNECTSPLDYTTLMHWQSPQTDFCTSGPALGKEEPDVLPLFWENILANCFYSSDPGPITSGSSKPKLSKWASFFGVTGSPSATVTITTPANGATYLLNEVVPSNYSCSGTFLECAGTVTNGMPFDTSSLGSKVFHAEASVSSGPSAQATSTYNITTSYQFIGFLSPVNNPPDLNVAKAGRAIPIKFQVLDANNNPVLGLTVPPVSIVSAEELCSALDTIISTDITSTAVGASGFQDLGGGFYQLNWATMSSWTGTCRQLQVNLGDGVLHLADFKFR